jgi:hypothetical protein
MDATLADAGALLLVRTLSKVQGDEAASYDLLEKMRSVTCLAMMQSLPGDQVQVCSRDGLAAGTAPTACSDDAFANSGQS